MSRFRLPAKGWYLVAIVVVAPLVILSTYVLVRPSWLQSGDSKPAVQPASAIPTASSPHTFAQVPLPTTPPTATAAPSPTPTPVPAPSVEQVKPNELGRIMILEYHMFGAKEDRWTRSYANFRKDLDRLYRSGFRPIGLNEYVDNRIDVPAGTSPIVMTFDDSSQGQLRYLPGADGKPTIDPDSAVGIILAFSREHPDWRTRGTFNVLAGVEEEHRLFGQPEYATQKLRQLVDLGFELGNHTYWHMQLGKLDKANVNKQLALAVKAVRDAVPGYEVNTLALPLGDHPAQQAWAVRGSYEGTEYHHRAILEVSGGGAYSPNNREADPLSLNRIQATHEELDFYTAYLDYYDQHRDERYVSDGNPDRLVFPAALADSYRAGTADQPLSDPALGYKAFKLR